jgi:L-asparaginase
LYFNGRLLRGCRATKVNAVGFAAFDSPNYPALANAGVEISINHHLLQPMPLPKTAVHMQEIRGPIVGALRLFPGISGQLLHNMTQPPLRGLVLEAYGTGNGPARDAAFMAALREATQERGVVIVACTQCLTGMVNLDKYATGAALAKVGVISGYDLTAEATLTKLSYLLNVCDSTDNVKRRMGENLRGELTKS